MSNTFTDMEYIYRKKKTKREEFLEIMRKFMGINYMIESVPNEGNSE